MTELSALAKVLGVAQGNKPLATPFELIARIARGLPLSALERVTASIAPGDAGFKYRIIPKASLARRRHDKRLTAAEGERLARIAAVWAFACEVWGDEAEARSFLFRAHPMLQDRPPIDLAIDSDLGARLVEGILGRLQYGSAA